MIPLQPLTVFLCSLRCALYSSAFGSVYLMLVDFYVSYELGNDYVCSFFFHSVLFVLLKSVSTLASIKAHESTLGNKVSRANSCISMCLLCNSHSFTCLLLFGHWPPFSLSLPLVYVCQCTRIRYYFVML